MLRRCPPSLRSGASDSHGNTRAAAGGSAAPVRRRRAHRAPSARRRRARPLPSHSPAHRCCLAGAGSSQAHGRSLAGSSHAPARHLAGAPRRGRDTERETLSRVSGGTRLSPWPPCDDPRANARGPGRVIHRRFSRRNLLSATTTRTWLNLSGKEKITLTYC